MREFNLTRKKVPTGFPCRSSYLELFSNTLERYPWRKSFCGDVWLINEHQSHMVLLFKLGKSTCFCWPHLMTITLVQVYNQYLKGAPKFYFTHYSCLIIILFNTGLWKSVFSTYSVARLVFCLSMFSVFWVLYVQCFKFDVIFIDFII